MAIQFFYLENSFTLRDRLSLKHFINSIFEAEQHQLDNLNYIFCSDHYLLQVNKTYLKHDYYTDIITFNMAASGKPVVGEIYISIDRVRDNAISLGYSFKHELHRVIFHGVLHLCGYRDKTKTEKLVMRAAEDRYLAKYFERST